MRHCDRQSGIVKGRRGAVALISVAVLMAILVVIGLTVSLIGRDEIVLSGVYRDGENAFSIADACAEEALTRLKADQAFTGTSFALDGGFCDSTVTNVFGSEYDIQATGSYMDNVRIIEANVTIQYNVQGNAVSVIVNSWKEAD